MPRSLLLALALSLGALSVLAQAPSLTDVTIHPGAIRYTLDLSDVAQHELHVTAHFPAVGADVFRVRMPQSSPGRYAVHNFAKNVYDFSAEDADGKAIEVHPDGLGAWAITGHGGAVTLHYTLFANGGDGTYAGVDDRKLHLNMPACFVYGEGLPARPVVLEIGPGQRPTWTVASQLPAVDGDRVRAAPDYAYFYDSPTMVGEMMRDSFRVSGVDGPGGPGGPDGAQTIEVAMMHEGTRAEFDAYVEDVEATVLAQRAIYGELPRFDYGRYTFLCAYNPYIGGDGMEHRNSTVCSSPRSLAEAADQLIGTVSHEFFHAWNVERIRPATLEPFDFAHANVSGELWFAEGFTSYYDDVALLRAGVITPEDYAASLTNQLNYVLLSPGRNHRSPVEMSQQAPFVDAATANDPDNFANTFVSYYSYGATLGLALDLQLRERGHTLDEVMRLMWRRYGKPEIPYHVRDIVLALADVTRDAAFAKTWFERHVYGSELPDLAALLAPYGFTLRQAAPDAVGFYRLRLRESEGSRQQNEGAVYVNGPVLETSPLYGAGLQDGVKVVSLDGKTIGSVADWEAAVGGLRVGQTVEVAYERLGLAQRGTFVAAASPELVLEVDEAGGREALKRRAGWLGR